MIVYLTRQHEVLSQHVHCLISFVDIDNPLKRKFRKKTFRLSCFKVSKLLHISLLSFQDHPLVTVIAYSIWLAMASPQSIYFPNRNFESDKRGRRLNLKTSVLFCNVCYGCPTRFWGTKCYVACPANEMEKYPARVRKQTSPMLQRC